MAVRCFLGLLAVAALASAAGVTPIEKVISLMKDLIAKSEAAMHDDDVKFASFSQWCDNQTGNKKEEIQESKDKIASLQAEIGECQVHIKDLTARIEELKEDVGRWKKDEKSASDIREKEAYDYAATLADLNESLTAVDSAIGMLQKTSGDVPQALLQVAALKTLQPEGRSALMAYLQGAQRAAQPMTEATDSQMKADGLNYAAPEANAYESQSGGIIGMLEDLKKDFEGQIYELEKSELNARHGFDAVMQSLADSIENAEHEIGKKELDRADTSKALAVAQGELAQTQADLAEDEKYLAEMTSLCEQKSADYDARSKLRAEEIETVKKAMEIIAGESVASAGEKHLPTLVQVAPALAQLRSSGFNPVQKKVAAFLAERAKALGSRTLSLMSQHLEEDPFKKVKKMIKVTASAVPENQSAVGSDIIYN